MAETFKLSFEQELQRKEQTNLAWGWALQMDKIREECEL